MFIPGVKTLMRGRGRIGEKSGETLLVINNQKHIITENVLFVSRGRQSNKC